jgi:hypothetical protein
MFRREPFREDMPQGTIGVFRPTILELLENTVRYCAVDNPTIPKVKGMVIAKPGGAA